MKRRLWIFLGTALCGVVLTELTFLPTPPLSPLPGDQPRRSEAQTTPIQDPLIPSAATLPTATVGQILLDSEVLATAPKQPSSAVATKVGEPLQALLATGKLVANRTLAEAGHPGNTIQIYQTNFKYPLIQVERDATGTIRSAVVADHLLVHRRPGVSHAQFANFVEQAGLRIRKHLYGDSGYLVAGSAAPIDAQADLQKRLTVPTSPATGIAPDPITTICMLPNDPSFNRLTGMHNAGDTDIDAPEAWDSATDASNVVVGVIDTGIDYTHPDLAANIWTNPGEISNNGIDDDGNGLVDDDHGFDFYNDDNNPLDDHQHGTHCAGTIGAVGNNGIGVSGVAWSVRMMALKAFNSDGNGAGSAIVEAITYAAEMGAKVTSNSWGSREASTAIRDAIAAAGNAGSLFVAAAGNDSANIDSGGEFPASCELDSVLSVAATDEVDALAPFSNYGLVAVDLAAPGTSIHSTFPGNQYGGLSGTSMAAPHVAGACALLLSQQPSLTPLQLKQHVMATVDRIPALGEKTVTGGRLNLRRMLLGLDFNPPVITSPLTALAAFGAPFSYTITASHAAADFSAEGLPPGLQIERDTGSISGNPAVTGVFAVTLHAANLGGTATAILNLTVAVATPVITSPVTAAGEIGEHFLYQITATNDPDSFAASGLPEGLSLDSATGVIAGLPLAAGNFTIELSATNPLGTTTLELQLVIAPLASPRFLGLLDASAVSGLPFSYQLRASNRPTRFAATGLPTGLGVAPLTGLISGIPTVTGAFTVTVEAENSVGFATAHFSLIVNSGGAPVLTTPAAASAPLGQPFTLRITATNQPDFFTASGLPDGLGVGSDGVIAGTPTVAGTVLVHLSASNASGTGFATLALTILPAPPVITSVTSASVIADQPFTYQISATGTPQAFDAAGLPEGLSLDKVSGNIVGSVNKAGVYQFVVSASNAGGIGSMQVTLQVLPPPPVISSALKILSVRNIPLSYQIEATNQPDIFAATDLPAGLTLNSTSGLISGEIASAGTYEIGIAATNAGGTGTATLIVTVDEDATRITSFSPAEVTPGEAVTISGVGFSAATEVYFSDRSAKLIPATNFQVVNDGVIQATVPYLTQANALDYSWIIVIAPRGLAVAFPPTSVEVFGGYDFGGSGGRFGVVHEGGALVGGGGGGNSIVVEKGGSARIAAGGGGHFFFVSGGGFLDLSGGSTGATIFRSPTSVILNETEIQSLPVSREVAAVRATILSQLLKVRQVPKFTSAPTAAGTVGTAFNHQFTVASSALATATTFALAGSPPSGLAFATTNGVLSGIPTTPGTYSLAVTATNSAGSAQFVLSVTISGELVPVITSGVSAEGVIGTAFTYQITAANAPASFDATGLPPGLVVHPETGWIDGSPTTNGIYSATVTATNALGTASRVVTFFIGLAPLAVTGVSPDAIAAGAELNLTGRGLTDVQRVYFISRSVQLVGDLGRTIQSDSAMKVVVPSLQHVWYDQSPVIATSADHTCVTFPANAIRYAVSGSAGGGGKRIIVGAGATVTLGGAGGHWIYVEAGGTVVTGGGSGHSIFLAPGATLNGAATLVLRSPGSVLLNQGTNTSLLVPPISLSVLKTNKVLNVFDLPAISSGDMTGQVGIPLSYATTVEGIDFGLSFAAQGLPPGLTIGATNGVISGTPSTAGSYAVVLTATGTNGPGSKTVMFTINPPMSPVLTSVSRVDGTIAATLNKQLTATNGPVTFTATGLPPGAMLSAGGLLSGIPQQSGVWIATLTLTNPNATTSIKLTIAIDRPQPTLTFIPAGAVVGQPCVLGGTGLAQTTAVYFNDASTGIGPAGPIGSATATAVSVITPAIQLNHLPGALLALVAEGGATVAVPATMAQVASGSSVTAGGGSYYRVRSGGTLVSTGSGGITAYAEAGSFVTMSGGGGQLVYAENGATVDLRNGNGTVLAAPNANVLGNENVQIIPVADLHVSAVPSHLMLSPIPSITSTTNVRGYLNMPFYFVIQAINNPASFAATGLPPGLALNPATGTISGQPATKGTFTTMLTAINSAGDFSAPLVFTIGGPVEQWRDTQFAALAGGADSFLAADDADPDGDSLNNLLEYAGKLDPNSPNATAELCHGKITAGHYQFSCRRLQGAGTGSVVGGYILGDIRYVIEWSGDLVQWQSGAEHFEQVGSAVPNGDGTETVTVRLNKPATELAKAYLRLRVERVSAP